MDVGTKIRNYIEENGISQIELSRKTGIPAPKLNLSLNAKRRLTFEEYEVICWALDLSVVTFLEPRPPVGVTA